MVVALLLLQILLSRSVAQADDGASTITPLAGFVPTTDVSIQSRIDVDLQQFIQLVSSSDDGWVAGLDFFNQSQLSLLSRANNGVDMHVVITTSDKSTRSDDFLPFFVPLYDYFGSVDYAHDFVRSGLTGSVTISGYTGNFDFTVLRGNDGSASERYSRVAIAQTVPVVMTLYAYIVRGLELAVTECQACTVAANNVSTSLCGLDRLDEAVAYYVGSLQGADGSGDGVLAYAMADKMCGSFATCSALATSSSDFEATSSDFNATSSVRQSPTTVATSRVNVVVMDAFSELQQYLQSNSCSEAALKKDTIRAQLLVPMIQGVLRALFLVDDDSNELATEATLFAAALLPLLNACNEDDANTIYEATKPGGSLDLDIVMRTLQFHYVTCFNISCDDVGGLWNDVGGDYYSGFVPCLSVPTVSPSPTQAPVTIEPDVETTSPTLAPTESAVVFPAASSAHRYTTYRLVSWIMPLMLVSRWLGL